MAGQKTRTLDDDTAASDPGGIVLSQRRLSLLRPDLYGLRGLKNRLLEVLGLRYPERTYISEQLLYGDSRAAVTMSLSPLLVAAYTDELDCIAMLEFPEVLGEMHGLLPGTRLLTVNTYGGDGSIDADLIPGSDADSQWTGFHPLIADFLTDDRTRLEARKREIDEEEWERAERMGREYLELRPGVARHGLPVFASIPAEVPDD